MNRPVTCAVTAALALVSAHAGAQQVKFDQIATVGAAIADTTSLTDPSVQVTPTTKRCGTERACVSGFDLRVLGVTLPDSIFGGGALTTATVQIDNRGRMSAPASELVVDVGDSKSYRAQLPAMPSGARATVRVPVRIAPTWMSSEVIRASLDPESLGKDANSDNNSSSSRELTVEKPRLVWQHFDGASEVRRGAPLLVHGVIRNPNQAASTPPTTVSLSGGFCLSPIIQNAHTDVPALAPGGTFSFTASIPTQACNGYDGVALGVTGFIDPDGKFGDGNDHEKRSDLSVILR